MNRIDQLIAALRALCMLIVVATFGLTALALAMADNAGLLP